MALCASTQASSLPAVGFLPVRAHLAVRDLLLASWTTGEAAVARVLPPGLEPAEIEGRHLVTVASFRVTHGRLGRLPIVPFSQLNVRVYATFRTEPAVYFVLARVTLPGLPGALFGAPYRPAVLRVRPGRLRAPGLGLALDYAPGDEGQPGLLGRHELGLFESGAGLGAFRIVRGEARWRRAAPTGEPRTELLAALGFEPTEPPALLYAEHASFDSTAPPERLAS
jgi:Uncharacterized conserved protein (COG2071)